MASSTIAEYSASEAGLAELRAKYAGAAFDVSTPPGMQSALSARRELRDLRVDLEERRKGRKAPVLELGARIDAEAQRITAEIRALESPIDAQIKAEEDRREQVRTEKRRAEIEQMKREAEAEATAKREAERAAAAAVRAEIDAEQTSLRLERQKLAAERAAAAAERAEADCVAHAERDRLAAEARAEAAERRRVEDAQRAERDRRAELEALAILAEREQLEKLRAEQERGEREQAIERATLLESAREAYRMIAGLGLAESLVALKLRAAITRAAAFVGELPGVP